MTQQQEKQTYTVEEAARILGINLVTFKKLKNKYNIREAYKEDNS